MCLWGLCSSVGVQMTWVLRVLGLSSGQPTCRGGSPEGRWVGKGPLGTESEGHGQLPTSLPPSPGSEGQRGSLKRGSQAREGRAMLKVTQ